MISIRFADGRSRSPLSTHVACVAHTQWKEACRLSDNTSVIRVREGSVAEIRQNSSIRLFEMARSDGTSTVTGLGILEAGDEVAPRLPPPVPNPCLVGTCLPGVGLVTAITGPMLTITTRSGERKISTNVPIVQFVTGDKGNIKPGANMFIDSFNTLPDGSLEASFINVGMDGIIPPM